MSELESMGIVVQRSFSTSSTEVQGIAVSSSETTELSFTLPKESPVRATFTKEGFTKKFVKIFKKEIQTGDEPFDQTVYIATETPEETTKLLESNVVRAIIARIVGGGGAVELDGGFVKLALPGHHESEDDDTITLVKAFVA